MNKLLLRKNLVLLLLRIIFSANAQNFPITGKVTTDENGGPLEGQPFWKRSTTLRSPDGGISSSSTVRPVMQSDIGSVGSPESEVDNKRATIVSLRDERQHPCVVIGCETIKKAISTRPLPNQSKDIRSSPVDNSPACRETAGSVDVGSFENVRYASKHKHTRGALFGCFQHSIICCRWNTIDFGWHR